MDHESLAKEQAETRVSQDTFYPQAAADRTEPVDVSRLVYQDCSENRSYAPDTHEKASSPADAPEVVGDASMQAVKNRENMRESLDNGKHQDS